MLCGSLILRLNYVGCIGSGGIARLAGRALQGINDWIDVQRIVCWVGDGCQVALDCGIESLHLLLLLGLLFRLQRPVLEHVLVLDL